MPTKKTTFRVHFRTSDGEDRKHMDVEASDVGDAHKAVRDKHQTKDVRVFIDKTKVLRAPE